MVYYPSESKVESILIQRSDNVSKITDVNMLIYALEIMTKIGKHFPILFISMPCLNVLMATNDFLTNSIEFGIMNSLFATSGFIFLVQMYHNNKTNSLYYNDKQSNQKLLETTELK